MTDGMRGDEERLPPVHPGEVLSEEFLIPRNMTPDRLARAIGEDAGRIHAITRCERSVTAETALLLSRYFGNSAAFWMGLQGQYDLETARDSISVRPERAAPDPPGRP